MKVMHQLFMKVNIYILYFYSQFCIVLFPNPNFINIAVVSFVFVPETRGLDLKELENIYKKEKPQVWYLEVLTAGRQQGQRSTRRRVFCLAAECRSPEGYFTQAGVQPHKKANISIFYLGKSFFLENKSFSSSNFSENMFYIHFPKLCCSPSKIHLKTRW